MQIYLPIAELAVHVETIFMIGGAVGILSGVFGVGGGFFATPFLIFLGIPPIIAVATQANNLVASSVSGAVGHLRRRNVDIKVAGVMLLGGLLGSFLGILVFKILYHLGQIDFAVSILYIILLSVIGSLMLIETTISGFSKRNMRSEFNRFRLPNLMARLPYKMRFPRSRLYISALVPGGIGFVGGVLASILGIGGGFLIVPAMIYILGMSPLLAAGTSLLQISFTTAIATIMHATMNQSVDLVLAIVLMVGGVIGSQIGVVLARRIKGKYARIILASLLLIVAVRLSLELFLQPAELFSTVLS